MLARWGIRLASSLIGVAAGMLVSAIVLSGFSVTGLAIIEATLLFWIVHLVVLFLALRIFIRDRSIVLAGLLALASTFIALIVVDVVFSGVSISGISTYVVATLIIWVTTGIGDVVGQRMIRARRRAA